MKVIERTIQLYRHFIFVESLFPVTNSKKPIFGLPFFEMWLALYQILKLYTVIHVIPNR